MTADPDELLAAWQRWIGTDTTRLDGLLARYRERHRKYHSVTHLAAVVDGVQVLAIDEQLEEIAAVAVVVAAAFYHDAIYEPTYPANERASARLARRDLRELGWADDLVEEVADMIEATREHLDPPDTGTAILFDADLAILGADSAEYAIYAKAVRSEYRHLDDDEWRGGRILVLQSFLDRENIFATGSGRRRWARAAAENLSSELETLQ